MVQLSSVGSYLLFDRATPTFDRVSRPSPPRRLPLLKGTFLRYKGCIVEADVTRLFEVAYMENVATIDFK